MTLSEQLASAQTALHDLLTGRAVRVVVDQNGERIEYAAASAPRLQAYVAELERKVSTTPTLGPLRVWF